MQDGLSLAIAQRVEATESAARVPAEMSVSFRLVKSSCPIQIERQRRVTQERRGNQMTRQSLQRGHIEGPIKTRFGSAFKIRYRIRSANGKWNQRKETLYNLPNKKAAQLALDARIKESTATLPEISEMTLRHFVDAYWKPFLDRKAVKPSTQMSYSAALEHHITPTFGDFRIQDIAPLQVERFIQKMLEGGLSSKSVRNVLGILQGIFSLAVDNDLLAKSPVRKRHKPAYRRTEKSFWTPAQVRAILLEAPAQFRALFVCVAFTGVRLGELLGLQWRHVDLKNRKLRIEQSIWHGQILPPKTESSVRTIFFGDVLAAFLQEHSQNATHNDAESFVFCKKDGSPLHPDVLRKDVLYPILDRLNIPRKSGASGFHTFRHSAASIINSQTGDLKLAQKLLGHSTINMTADVYTHTSAEAERQAVLAVERAICGDLFPIVPSSVTGNKSTAVN